MDTRDGCSNSLDFPEDWIGIPEFFTATSKECCDFFFEDKCNVYEVCDDAVSTKVSLFHM
jgi:hypothetical protein